MKNEVKRISKIRDPEEMAKELRKLEDLAFQATRAPHIISQIDEAIKSADILSKAKRVLERFFKEEIDKINKLESAVDKARRAAELQEKMNQYIQSFQRLKDNLSAKEITEAVDNIQELLEGLMEHQKGLVIYYDSQAL